MNPGETETLTLAAGHVLTVTVPSGSTGTLTRLRDSAGGGDPFTPVALDGADVSVGPFPSPRRYAIVDTIGSITYASAIFDPADYATDDEVAAGIVFNAPTAGVTLKRGANGLVGTFVCNGATPVTVNNTSIDITDAIIISLNTVGGTVGAVPAVKTITAATGFTVAGTASDTSTYNYAIIKNAA